MLSHTQKRILSQLSDRAFDKAAAAARARGEEVADTTAARAEYRHQQVALATGKLGLRCCGQDDYKPAEAHFLTLLGEHGRAVQAQVRAATNPRRVIEFKIIEACKEANVRLAYAEAICRAQNRGAGLAEVPPGRLWNIFYTIRNRGRARRQAA